MRTNISNTQRFNAFFSAQRQKATESVILCMTVLSFFACSDRESLTEEPSKGNLFNYKCNEWTYAQMKHHYYWCDDLPSTDSVDFNVTPSAFYGSLKSKKDRFSYYETNTAYNGSLDRYMQTLGIVAQEYEGASCGPVMRIELVEATSPFAQTLKRGDWILRPQPGADFLERIAWRGQSLQSDRPEVERYDTLKTHHSLRMDFEPENASTVYLDSIYMVGGHRIGYFYYKRYEEATDLFPVLSRFREADITDLVIDLRSNGGGLVRTAVYLASAFAPDSCYGMPATYLRYNRQVTMDRFGDTTSCSIYRYFTAETAAYVASHPKRICFLVSRHTASASESTIKMISSYADVALVGESTCGKGVGMYDISDSNYPMVLVPITFRYFNSLWQTVPDEGLAPDVSVTDVYDVNLKEIGSLEEPLLRKAVQLIVGDEGETPLDSLVSDSFSAQKQPRLSSPSQAYRKRPFRPVGEFLGNGSKKGMIVEEKKKQE